MKEVLKKICENQIELLKQRELNNYLQNISRLTSLKSRYEKYNLFMENLSKDVLDEIVSKDFKVEKYSIRNDFITDKNEMVDKSGLSVFYEIEIYVIEEIKKLFFFINEDGDAYLDGGPSEILDFIEDNYDEFIRQIYNNNECDKTYKELYDLYYDYKMVLYEANTPLIFYSRKLDLTKIAELSGKYSSNLIDLLIELYGNNKKVENFNKIIESCRIRAIELILKTQTELIEQKEDAFYLQIWRHVFGEYLKLTQPVRQNFQRELQDIKIHFNEDEIQRIESSLLQSQHIKKVSKLLYTFVYTRKLLKEQISVSNYDFFDLTFIAVSLFKVVEILFNELLNKKWANLYINTSKGSIKLGLFELTLGEMCQIFEDDKNGNVPQEIKQYLNTRKLRKDELKNLLSRWVSKTRNGFLHKDIIEIGNDMIDASIKDSIAIICLLMLVFGDE